MENLKTTDIALFSKSFYLLGVSLKETEEEAFDEESLKSGLYFKIRPILENIFSLQAFAIKGHIKRGIYIPSHIHLYIQYLLLADERRPLKIKPDENSDVKWLLLDAISKNSIKEIVDFFDPVFQKNIRKLKQTLHKI